MPTWKAGITDEVWKVLICARDISAAKDALSLIAYICGEGNDAAQIVTLRSMTGEQIVDAVQAFILSNTVSIERGLRVKGHES